jgi:hypothetical protein
MPQDNNQPAANPQDVPSLQGWPLDNFIFISDSLKGFKFGDEFNADLYKAMAKPNNPTFELSRDFNLPQFEALRDVNMSIPKEPVRYILRFDQIETEKGKMHVLSQIEASLLKNDKPEVSATFRVFQKTGFNAFQMRNLLQGRIVAHNRRSMRGKIYLAYSKLDLIAPKDDSGNTKLNSVPAFRQDYDAAKLLGKVLPNNYTQQDKDEIGRRLDNGDIVPLAKRAVGGNLDVIHLYADQQQDALMVIDKNGEVRKITAPTMEVIRSKDQNTSQTHQQGKSNTAGGDDKLTKAAQAAQQMEGVQNPPPGTRQRPKAA